MRLSKSIFSKKVILDNAELFADIAEISLSEDPKDYIISFRRPKADDVSLEFSNRCVASMR